MKKQGNMSQAKEQSKSTDTDHNERELSDLLSREFKIMAIKMLTEVRKTIHEQRTILVKRKY